MSEKSDKHGPRLDEQLQRETEGLMRGGGPTHVEPGSEPEPVETDAGRDPTAGTPRDRGTPSGMTAGDVEMRSAFAKVLAGARYPATPGELSAYAAEEGAPELTVQTLDGLPEGTYDGLPDVLEALGYGRETGRF